VVGRGATTHNTIPFRDRREDRMNQVLRRIGGTLYHFQNGQCVGGAPTELYGDVSGLSGDVDACGLTDSDREAKVGVAQLVA
jgi:hypothetical protein